MATATRRDRSSGPSRTPPAVAAGIDRTRLPPVVPGRRILNLVARYRDTRGLYEWLHREYGPIVRYRILGFEFCILSDPDLTAEVLFTKRALFEKGFLYKRGLLLPRPTVITADGEEHKRRRRLVQPYFHRKMMSAYSTIMAEEAVAMRDGWKGDEPFDMYKAAHALTLSVSLRIFFGGELRVDTVMLRRVFNLFIIDFGLAMLMGRGVRRMILGSFRRHHRAYQALCEQVATLVEIARADDAERPDLISYLARATEEDGQYAHTTEEVGDGALEMLVSSLATTAVTMTWAIYYLAQNPAARERLEREIDEVLDGRVATFEDFDDLAYTGAVIAETLRFAPPAYYIGRRAKEDCSIGDYFIPAGSNVQIFYLLAQKDERYFPQPDAFRPERWLEDVQPERPRCAYMPFGAANRHCAGEAFARVNLTFALASIVQRWRVDLVSKEFPKLKTFAFLDFKDGLPVRAGDRAETHASNGGPAG